MINPSELIFCVDEKNNPIQSLPRYTAHRDHIWHRTTDIWVMHPSGKKILCHKRSAKKDADPSLFDSTFGGHLLAGDAPERNAERELAEELGIDLDNAYLRFVAVIQLTKIFEYQYRYLYTLHEDITQLKFEKEEIDTIFWKDIHELIMIYKEQKDATWVYRERELEMLQSIVS